MCLTTSVYGNCKKCGIQYLGETSQALSRMNNHKQRLNQMFLYQHLCSNDHSNNDIVIMPIEEVSFKEGKCLSVASKTVPVLIVGQWTISDQISWMCNLSCTWAYVWINASQVVANLQPISCHRH